MKKLSILAFFASTLLLFNSCGLGAFIPYANNNYGIQTQVVLDRANYRIVDNVEVVIEVNNTKLKRRDVEKSAMGELMRRYKLTGSQAFINVTIEEIDRQNTNFFFVLFGLNLVHHKQHVAARATIIEFLQENGMPVASAPSSQASTTASDAVSFNQTSVVPQSAPAVSQVASAQTSVVSQETHAVSVPREPMADSEEAQKMLGGADRLIKHMKKSRSNEYYSGYVKVYKELYMRAQNEPTVTAIENLRVTSLLVTQFLNGGASSDEIEREFKKEKNMDRCIEILVEYAKNNVN